LVVAGADVNFEDPVRKRPVLYEATLLGYEQLVTDMLLSGASPSCRDNSIFGASPLHIAAARGLNRIVSTLLLGGADKDALTCGGQTPLVLAAHGSRLSVVKTLLAAGADTSIRDNDGASALDSAAGEVYSDVIEALAEHGADMSACDDNGFTALHAAAARDHAGAVDTLIKAGADVEFKADCGSTPLTCASVNSNCKAMHALLQHGAQVDVRNDEGCTPLHEACRAQFKGVEVVVDSLLRWGADETILDNFGRNPAKMLDVEDGRLDSAAPDEIDRTRVLLSRAPADRAWRRRGWLVMLGSRDSKARKRKRSAGGHGDGGEVGGGCEIARSDGMAGGGEEGLRLEVLLLLGLGLEGVFRTVVGFL
ncbi:unnamed protein product, partial [Ectocarpus fasciculatus]